MTILNRIAENILVHLEANGMPRVAHGQRLTNVALVASVLVQSLTHEGYVQIVRPNGEPVRPEGTNDGSV